MRRFLRWAGAALLAGVLLAIVYVAVQIQRRPPLEPYRALTLPEAAPAPGELRVRFAGVSTLLFDDGETAWMTDGFFSRPGLKQTFTSRIAPDAQVIERELQRLHVGKLAAVVPVHSHYDHALDAPVMAQRSGALLVGSASTLNIGRGLGLRDSQMREVRPGDTLRLGKFTITFIESRHSPTPLNDGVTRETIDAPLTPPARATDWRTGSVWSLLVEHEGRRLLVQGSAGFVPGALAGRRADVVFLGVGTLGKKSDAYRASYWNEVVKSVGARRVIPVHWDDFWLPLSEPLQAMPLLFDDFGVSMTYLSRRAAQDGVELRLPPTFLPFAPFAPAAPSAP